MNIQDFIHAARIVLISLALPASIVSAHAVDAVVQNETFTSRQAIDQSDRREVAKGLANRIVHAVVTTPKGMFVRSSRYKGSSLVSTAEWLEAGNAVAAGDAYLASTAINTACQLEGESTIRCPVQPSIFAGRTAQYTVDSTTASRPGRFIKNLIHAGCYGVNTETWQRYYIPGSIRIDWSVSSNGGHVSHVGAQPSLMFYWSGQSAQQFGDNLAPAAFSGGSYILAFTADDSETWVQGWSNGGNFDFDPGVSIYLPETSQTDWLTLTEPTCDGDGAASVASGTFSWVFDIGMEVELMSVADFTSSNGQVSLQVQRVGNSHASVAGYATPTNASKLTDLVERFSQCSARTVVTEGLSIENGGLYDIQKNWTYSHRNHRAGEDADIGFNGWSQQDRNCLYAAYQTVYTTPVSSESLVLDVNGDAQAVAATHVHLWTGESHQYAQDQTSVLKGRVNALFCNLGACGAPW